MLAPVACPRKSAAAAASARAPPARRRRVPTRVSTTLFAPIAISKSCAARPIRRSGGSRSMPAFMMRDMKRSASALRGQLPSFSPPITSVSTLCSRASSAPQMEMRRSPCLGLTTIRRDQRVKHCPATRLPANVNAVRRPNDRAQKLSQLFACIAGVEIRRRRLPRRVRCFASATTVASARSAQDRRSSVVAQASASGCDDSASRASTRPCAASSRDAVSLRNQFGLRSSLRKRGAPTLRTSAAARYVGAAGTAAQGHQFDRLRRTRASHRARRPSPTQRMLQQRQQRDRVARRARRQRAASRSSAAAVRWKRRAAGIVGPDAEAQAARPRRGAQGRGRR